MTLNEFGVIAMREWIALGERFENLYPGVFVIMPNHMHGILHILNNTPPRSSYAKLAPTIGDMIGVYKSRVAANCLQIYKSQHETMGSLWQRNYYEHIIRNEESYLHIANYIAQNPSSWKDDIFY